MALLRAPRLAAIPNFVMLSSAAGLSQYNAYAHQPREGASDSSFIFCNIMAHKIEGLIFLFIFPSSALALAWSAPAQQGKGVSRNTTTKVIC